MISKFPTVASILRNHVKFTEGYRHIIMRVQRPSLICGYRSEAKINLSSSTLCTMASVPSNSANSQAETSKDKIKKTAPKVHTRRVYSGAGKGVPGPGQPSVEDVEQRLKEWESDIDIEQLTDKPTHKKIHHCHLAAVKAGKEMYEDPSTGFEVFTILAHLRRGYCCGNACRHCPYKHINVASKYRDIREYNSSFYA